MKNKTVFFTVATLAAMALFTSPVEARTSRSSAVGVPGFSERSLFEAIETASGDKVMRGCFDNMFSFSMPSVPTARLGYAANHEWSSRGGMQHRGYFNTAYSGGGNISSLDITPVDPAQYSHPTTPGMLLAGIGLMAVIARRRMKGG